MQSRKYKITGGFTLVELLVVIGIIALLITILLPALSSARRQALCVKCASNLRQCYTAIMLYADAYDGYGVPPRAGGGYPGINGGSIQSPSTDAQVTVPIKYYYNGIWYGIPTGQTPPTPGPYTNSAVWWQEFVAKFLGTSKGGQGDTADTQGGITGNNGLTAAQAMERARNNSVFWCPAWQAGVTQNNSQPLYSGYAMNYMVSVTPNHPVSPSGSPSNFPNGSFPNFIPSNSTGLSSREWFNIELDPSQSDYYNPRSGKWYKVTQISMKSERCLLADSGGLLLECWQAPNKSAADGTLIPPPQGLMESFSPGGTTTSGISGQNAFDCYRHGVYPNTIQYTGPMGSGGPVYSPIGGKVAYNILYWDGHVSTRTDRRDSYRSVRMRYPG